MCIIIIQFSCPLMTFNGRYDDQLLLDFQVKCKEGDLAFFRLTSLDLEGPDTCRDPMGNPKSVCNNIIIATSILITDAQTISSSIVAWLEQQNSVETLPPMIQCYHYNQGNLMSLFDRVKREISQGFRCTLFVLGQMKGICKVHNSFLSRYSA